MKASPATPVDRYEPAARVAPLLVRPVAMELLWVCGDCGDHVPRSTLPPDTCAACGASRLHYYSPTED